MPSIRHFTIVFDKPVFMPGEPITGRAMLALNEPLGVDSIVLEFCGEARVGWHESELFPDRDARGETEMRTRIVYYRAARDYVNGSIQAYGKGQLTLTGGNTADNIGGGGADYVWPFNFQLPAGIPSSFEGRHGSIRYFIKSTVKKSALVAINHRKKTFFNVFGFEDCNLPQYRIPLQIEDQKRTCCWCCASDPIRMQVRVDRSAYTPLDKIAIFASFDNRSARELEPRAALIQTVTYRAHRGYASDYTNYYIGGFTHTKVEHHTVCEMQGKKISPQSTDAWSPALLQIPIVAPTISSSCDILMVQYHVKVVVHIPRGKDMEGLFPITVGTIPFGGAVGFGAATPASTGGAFSGQQHGNDMMNAMIMASALTPHAPQPTDYNSNAQENEAGKLSVNNNQVLPYPNGAPTHQSETFSPASPIIAPPAYWELFPKPPEPETEEEA